MRRHDEGWWKYKAQSCQPEDCCIPLASFVFCDLFCSVFIHWLVSTKRTLFDVRQNGSVIICPFTTAALHISRVHGTQCDTELSWTSIDTCVTLVSLSPWLVRHWQLWQIWLWQRSTPWEWEQADHNPVLPRNFSNPHGTIDVIMKRVESSLKMHNPSNFIQIQSVVSTVSWATDKQMTD